MEDFFKFARERHSIYLRRQAGLPRPWTDDPILNHYRFTNVFRELDATTVWFKDNVREPMRDKPEVLLATVLFRWFNRMKTGEAIFNQKTLLGNSSCTAWQSMLNHGETSDVAAAIRAFCGKGPYVTGAYIIKTPNGMDKLTGVLQCVEWFMEKDYQYKGSELFSKPLEYQWRGLANMIQQTSYPHTLEDTWKWLKQFPYMGDFMAYEVVTDLRHTALLENAPDIMTWANPGPGAARGMGRVLNDDKDMYNQHRDKKALILHMRELLEDSKNPENWPQQTHDEIQTSGEFAESWDKYQMWGPWPRWEMRDIEHTLCEFDKYERARLGEGRPRGVYK